MRIKVEPYQKKVRRTLTVLEGIKAEVHLPKKEKVKLQRIEVKF